MANKIKINKSAGKPQINPFEKFLSAYCNDEWMFLVNNNLQVLSFKKDERIITEGSEVKGVYFLNKGMIKVVSNVNKTDERILRLSGEGALVGHRGIAFKNYPISVIALSDIEVTFLPLKIFRILIKTNTEFSLFLINFISEELRNAENQMKNMIFGEVTKRIAYILCLLIDTFGYKSKGSFELNFTLPRKDIANLAGTTYESVVRTIALFEDKNILKVDGKSLIVLTESGLRKIAQDK